MNYVRMNIDYLTIVWHTVRVFVFLSKLNYVQFAGEQITIRYRLMVRIHQSFDFCFRNRERERE